MIEHKIVAGISTIYKTEARHQDTLPCSSGTGIMDCLISTPALMTMVITASSELLDPLLPEGYITVGKNMELSHERPTLVGEMITLAITVTKIKGDTIHLEVTGHDSTGLICRGSFDRSIVNRDHLIDIAYRRSKHLL